ATAASTALPPACSTSTPTAVASGASVTTIACGALTASASSGNGHPAGTCAASSCLSVVSRATVQEVSSATPTTVRIRRIDDRGIRLPEVFTTEDTGYTENGREEVMFLGFRRCGRFAARPA